MNEYDNDGNLIKEADGVFLYTSTDANEALSITSRDRRFLISTAGYLGTGFWPFAVYSLLTGIQAVTPAIVSVYYCWHARLDEEAKQVIFYKTGPLGTLKQFRVNIRDLEKIEKEDYPINPIVWTRYNSLDENLIFRDSFSGEIFIFDKHGYWDEDVLKHPLIN